MKNNIIPILSHIKTILKHKWYIMIAGRKTGCSFYRCLTHDMSKLRWSELPHYARQFYGDDSDIKAWNYCWLKHTNRNDHHWQYWVKPEGRFGTYICLEMPEAAIREMLADWFAAGKVYNGAWPDLNEWTWLRENWDKMHFNDITRGRIINIINEIRGYVV